VIVAGSVWLFGDNINTDLMYPNVAFRATDQERRRLVFSANRPGWSERVKQGDVIVAGSNFGTGSGRPGSKYLRQLGIAGIVAESMNGLFFRNSINYAMPVMECRGIVQACQEGDPLKIDFRTGAVLNNRTGAELRGGALPPFLLDIVESGGLLPRLARQGLLEDTATGADHP
jgi:3-isopropylmalate/(R)-2-methylmalate dehydratase small subunit